jgi:tRNA G18 (ribose-2'-O)-methylase SpoU
VYVEQGGTAIPNFDWDHLYIDTEAMDLIPVLVFGNENRGIPDELLNDKRRDIVSVSQRGVVRSYNVGVTSGIVISDMLTRMRWW